MLRHPHDCHLPPPLLLIIIIRILPGITILGLDTDVAPATLLWKSSNQTCNATQTETRGFETGSPKKGKSSKHKLSIVQLMRPQT